jgi:hypothetical protein
MYIYNTLGEAVPAVLWRTLAHSEGPTGCNNAAKRSRVLQVVASRACLLVCGTDFMASHTCLSGEACP